MQTAPVTFEELYKIMGQYCSDAHLELLQKAYTLAEQSHSHQVRLSGEPYIVHPLGVGKTLADLQFDVYTVIAGLLHDVVEDTDISLKEIESRFGAEVALLVDGVTKLSRIVYKTAEEQKVESYMKMFFAMAKDIRVVVIKLADRLHNMKTLKYMPEEKQQRIAQETLEIYSPLAHRLGMYAIKCDLEDLSFRILQPDKYYDLAEKVQQKRKERDEIVKQAADTLLAKLDEVEIKAELQWRSKHLYSIHKKMQRDGKDINEIFDLSAIRLLVNTNSDCYAALGIVHTLWKPLPGRFKDYISSKKNNEYQSLHTTVIGIGEQPLEIQIRTWEMHHIAEYGVAAHWRYKEGHKGGGGLRKFEKKLSELRQLLEWQGEVRDPAELLETIKLDFLTDDEVIVFTPKGNVVNLPRGAVPIDFAYRVHTQVGHSCVGARVNGKMVPLEHKLATGDIVEIITSKNSHGPSRDWLNFVGSSTTKNKIKQWFKQGNREENIDKGKELLEKEIKRLGYELKDVLGANKLQEVARKINLNAEEDVYAAIGFGDASLHTVVLKLVDLYKKDHKQELAADDNLQILSAINQKQKKTSSKQGKGILVKGEGGMAVHLARCCSPVQGDEIIGYVTRGKGVSIHRADCSNMTGNHNKEEYERMIDVSWDSDAKSKYNVAIEIEAGDRAGLLTEIMIVATENKFNVTSVEAKSLDNQNAKVTLRIDVDSVVKLEAIMVKLRRVKGILSVKRAAIK